jgi:lactate dehydrogenase-like 2-hydroxyacid dehydrogenase
MASWHRRGGSRCESRRHTIAWAAPEAFIKRFPALEIVANFGVGYEHIDAAAAGSLGVIVTHTPNVLTEEVADTAMGLLLSTVRRLPQADRYVRTGKWLEGHYPLSASLRGRKLGMLGFGRIGKAIARRAAAFGLEISYHTRKPQTDQPYRHYSSLLEMARAVDILIVSVPGGPDTKHLVGAEVLSALGADGILINVGRGSVVDEAALIAALKNGTILSAGLDVFPNEPHVAPELLEMDHIVLFPHVGSGSFHARHAMAQLAADNLLHWFAGKGPLTPVPETPYPRP